MRGRKKQWRNSKREAKTEGGRQRKEDKEDFVESQEVEGRAWKERGRKGWEERRRASRNEECDR